MPVLRLSLADLAVGQRYVSDSYTLSAEEIKNYARQFDPQPFHLDEAAAMDSPFGGLVASGWHTAAICMRLIVNSIQLQCGLIGLGATIAWQKPVKAGDSIHVESEITSIIPSRSKPGQAVVETRAVVRNAQGDVVVELGSKLMVFSGFRK